MALVSINLKEIGQNPTIGSVGGVAVTPSDTTLLSNTARGFIVGATGNVTVLGVDGNAVTFTACPVGVLYPIWFNRVNATGTTTADIVALW